MTTNFDQIKSYSISKKDLELDFNRSHIIKYFTSSFLKNLSLENPKNVILNIPYLNTSRKWILFDVLLNHMEHALKNSKFHYAIAHDLLHICFSYCFTPSIHD